MFVTDCYDACRSITNFTDDDQNLEQIGDAVDVLCNKGNFNGQLGYVNIAIPANGVARLPRDVDVPLKVQINGIPALGRDKFYEFAMNGPGKDEPRLGWQWEDRMWSCLKSDPAYPVQLRVNSLGADAGKTMTIYGRDTTDGTEISQTITFDGTGTQLVTVFSDITHIHKDETIAAVTLVNEFDGSIFSSIENWDTEPRYRLIKFSKTSGVASIMFRRNKFKVRSIYDFIPIRSKVGLLLMLQALKAYRNEDVKLGDDLEKQAVNKTNEEQESSDAFVQLAASEEKAGSLNLGINNRDTAIVADIIDEVYEIIGPQTRQKAYDEITKACQILSNKAQWDAQRGFVDIVKDQYNYVSLPRYVDTVLALNINRRRANPLNSWFEFNRMGQSSLGQQDWQPFDSWTDIKETAVLLRDLQYTVKLGVDVDLDEDLGVEVRISGYYQGKRVQTQGVNGETLDYAVIPASADGATLAPFNFDRIERVWKTETKGYVKLISYDINGKNPIVVGYYWPDETEPNYHRIRVPSTCSTVRIMYRRRELKFSTLTDPLHLKIGSAVVEQVRAKYLRIAPKPDLQGAAVAEKLALTWLEDEQAITNQTRIPELEFDDSMITHYVR